jgi:hypothetical protein
MTAATLVPRPMPKTASTDVATLRARARKDIEDGAVTAGYTADRAQVLEQLNAALATELVCVLRYRRHHFMARGIHAKSTADEFLAHSNEEQGHADRLAACSWGASRILRRTPSRGAATRNTLRARPWSR